MAPELFFPIQQVTSIPIPVPTALFLPPYLPLSRAWSVYGFYTYDSESGD